MLVRNYLEQLRNLPMGTVDTIASDRPILVIAPHQDDESLGCGGLIAALRERGQGVFVVFVTDGSASHPNSPGYPGPRLAAVRRDEALAALESLGVPSGCCTFLALQDTAAPSTGRGFDKAVARMAELVTNEGIGTVFCTSGHDPHCDHKAAATMAHAVVSTRQELRLFFYPVWSWHLPPNDPCSAAPPQGYRLDISPWLDRKTCAIACHRSQMTDLIDDDPSGFTFKPEQLAPFLQTVETYVEAV